MSRQLNTKGLVLKNKFFDVGEGRIQSGILPREYPARNRKYFTPLSDGDITSATLVTSVNLSISTPPGNYTAIGSVVGNV